MDFLDRISTGWKAWFILFALTMTAAAPGVFNLPALDRDESRFAQASKQMLEDGDYIRIKYQDELRNQKPAGIHWLQAASTAIFTGPEAKQIWTYRVPSWIGAGLGTLMCFWCGLPLIGRRASFLGAAMFGTTLLLTSEAHISKTDGMLVFLTTLGIGALARLYVRKDHSKKMAMLFWLAMGTSFLIKGPVTPMVAAYAGIGAWVWMKAATGKGGDWWKPLIWWPGPALFVLLVLPWFIWIQTATDGLYVKGAVGKDLKDKFTGASEGHGGWPLYHLTHIPAWFFPATLMIVPATLITWVKLRGEGLKAMQRGNDALLITLALAGLTAFTAWVAPQFLKTGVLVAYPSVLLIGFWFLSTRKGFAGRWGGFDAPPSAEVEALRFIAAWAILTLLFFELMPTRLSHYILPAYPAFGLLCGYAATKMMEGVKMPVSSMVSGVLFAIGIGVLLAASYPAVASLFMAETAGDFKTTDAAAALAQWQPQLDFPIYIWVGALLLAIATLVAFARRHIGLSVLLGVLTSFAIGWHVRIHFLPSQIWIQPTETARAALQDVCGVPGVLFCKEGGPPPKMIQAVGYAEPSYVLTLGTQNLHPPETVLTLSPDEADYPMVYLINLENKKGGQISTEIMVDLEAQGRALGRCIRKSPSHFALNYSNGDPAHFVALRFDTPQVTMSGEVLECK